MGTGGYIGGLDMDWSTTDFSCSTCGEAVQYAEETFVITVVLAQLTERGMLYSPLVFSDGDFLYEPNYLCTHCWAESEEELYELVRDMPPVEDDQSITDCSFCRSGIRGGEVVGLSTQGEVRRSKRSPSGHAGGNTFECTTDDPRVMCISCINKLSEHIIDELWNDGVRQFRECPEGTEIRCWRSGCPAEEESDCANCNVAQQTG